VEAAESQIQPSDALREEGDGKEGDQREVLLVKQQPYFNWQGQTREGGDLHPPQRTGDLLPATSAHVPANVSSSRNASHLALAHLLASGAAAGLGYRSYCTVQHKYTKHAGGSGRPTPWRCLTPE
jgi:hypothetical protein